MSDKLIQSMAIKLGYRQNPQILRKTTENSRLLHLKPNPMISSIGEIAKVVLCVDLAASGIGISFDTELALKMCGLRKSQYANYRRTVQKLIGGTKTVGIPELSLQLGLPSQIQEAAAEELPKYLKYMSRVNRELDRKHPQYAAVVLYRIARQRKVKVSKTVFANVCSLKSDQWRILEESWEKFEKESLSNKPREEEKPSEDVEMVEEQKKEVAGEEIEDYETWKKRILTGAFENLRKKH